MQDLPRPKSSSTNMSRASLAAPHREARLGFILSGAFFVGLLGWAAFVPLDAGAMADGIVAVSGNRQVVQHRDGGVITDLYVTEGQTVRAGQPLLRVATPELVASERAMTSELVSLLARRARLAAERDGRGELTEPAEFANLPAADVALAQEALAGQRQLLKARRASIQTERAVLSQRVRQQSEQIGGLSHQMGSNREQSRLLGEELEGMKRLLPDGFVAVNRIRAMERNVSELDGQYGALRADTARTSEAIGETRLQMVSLDRIRLEEITTELGELQQRLDEIQPKLDAMREQVAGSIIRAPTGGKVVGLTTFTIGGVVAAGATIMEIVPQDRALVVEAKAAPTDADDLRVGMNPGPLQRASGTQPAHSGGGRHPRLRRQLRRRTHRRAIFRDRDRGPARRTGQDPPDSRRHGPARRSARRGPGASALAQRPELSSGAPDPNPVAGGARALKRRQRSAPLSNN
ncbi:MAG: HlyD family type I secretion periplasmic adaptor subunit [Brevundimonas sp.]|nr:HlyD family type I secretion periplasmic adaptor subunit [Brevundimonas sp.]